MTEIAQTRPHICVCVCTFRRPSLLRQTLEALTEQESRGRFTFSIVVADNDQGMSARPVVDNCARNWSGQITYCSEPVQNIALARNLALRHATGDYVALIDDDEVPAPDWLMHMLQTCQRLNADGVLGPVLPRFEVRPPSWILKGSFCQRPQYSTGYVLAWQEARTGNALLVRAMLERDGPVFDARFADGGEDMDFFRRMTGLGRRFVWCQEAPVYEAVPANRLTRSYMWKRALLRGKNILKQPARAKYIAVSLLAAPVYLATIPVTLVLGHHRFMKSSISFCDHVGRLLGALGVNPVNGRGA